ncbi:DinB/UmuC family translesion DNA polymerase [Streptomyces globisporus]
MSASHRFDRDELNPDQHHRAVLGLVQDLGGRLRTSREITQALTLTVTYADRTQTTRRRSLTEPTAHTPALAATARTLLTGFGLQRARVRTLSVHAERLHPAEDTVHQLTLDAAQSAPGPHAVPVISRPPTGSRWSLIRRVTGPQGVREHFHQVPSGSCRLAGSPRPRRRTRRVRARS